MNTKSFALAMCLLSFAYVSYAVPVRMTNACPDCDGFDLICETRIVFSNVKYKEVRDVTLFWPGTRKFQIRDTGTMNVRAEFDLFLNMENPITVSVINFKDKFNYMATQDWTGTGLEFPKFAVKVIHLSPTSDAVDLLSDKDEVLFQNVNYLDRTDYIQLDSSSAVGFKLRKVSTGDVIATLPARIFEAMKISTIFVFGDYVVMDNEDMTLHLEYGEFHGYDLALDGPNRPPTNPQLVNNQPY